MSLEIVAAFRELLGGVFRACFPHLSPNLPHLSPELPKSHGLLIDKNAIRYYPDDQLSGWHHRGSSGGLLKQLFLNTLRRSRKPGLLRGLRLLSPNSMDPVCAFRTLPGPFPAYRSPPGAPIALECSNLNRYQDVPAVEIPEKKRRFNTTTLNLRVYF